MAMRSTKATRLLLSALALLLCLTLCACGSAKITGTWSGDGSMDVLGANFPFTAAVSWTFSEDGTATALLSDGSTQTCQYSLTDDTLTLVDEELGYGILYTLEGDTLTLNPGDLGVPGVYSRD